MTTSPELPYQFSIPAELVEHILMGPTHDRRVLQESPLLGDVWARYALDAGVKQDVLITPHKDSTAAWVAKKLSEIRWQQAKQQGKAKPKPAQIAYLQGLVAARVYFHEVLSIIIPMSQWWGQQNVQKRIDYLDRNKLKRLLRQKIEKSRTAFARNEQREIFTSLERYIVLAGLIYWIGKLERDRSEDDELERMQAEEAYNRYEPHIDDIVSGMLELYQIVKTASGSKAKRQKRDSEQDSRALVFQVSLNRPASAAMERSIPAVKADAAQSLFKVSCEGIIWAVLDAGIHGQHKAFMKSVKGPNGKEGKPVSRVKKTFDFTRIREIVSDDDDLTPDERKELARAAGLKDREAETYLEAIAKDARDGLPINWAVVEKLVTVKEPSRPATHHGTHVAGIIGADGRSKGTRGAFPSGMCPDIGLYDFRVLGKTEQDTEFAVIAALQYIRYVNERHNYIIIQGANLSLSIRHSVRNFACGRTPVCNECERLVESGVVVVAAAGNHGYQSFETKDGPFESYAAFSITDPGNCESVITVGSTHSIWPHTYGVSFFSSRGPTGDGRLKPDLVAPGERIQSTVHGQTRGEDDWAPESGTSMAAPHVSGAAAMLLARYEELIGQPRRVKQILCDTATDLGRERTFQGHGMLDVLRAFQSI